MASRQTPVQPTQLRHVFAGVEGLRERKPSTVEAMLAEATIPAPELGYLWMTWMEAHGALDQGHVASYGRAMRRFLDKAWELYTDHRMPRSLHDAAEEHHKAQANRAIRAIYEPYQYLYGQTTETEAPGKVRKDIRKKSKNPYAVESCHIKIQDSDVTAHIWRFLYDVARQYRESFDVYGTKKSFEWTLVENEPHVIHTAKKPEPEIPSKVEVPDFAHLLPEPIRKFTMPQEIHDA